MTLSRTECMACCMTCALYHQCDNVMHRMHDMLHDMLCMSGIRCRTSNDEFQPHSII